MTSTGEGVEKKGNRKDTERVIPATRRPDGSLRKERRVRAGYTAPEEVPAYVAPHIRARRAREAAAAAGTTTTSVDESELLSKLGKLKLDQPCPAKTQSTQSSPSMKLQKEELQEDEPKDPKVKPQHTIMVRGRGKSTFSKYSADTDERNEDVD